MGDVSGLVRVEISIGLESLVARVALSDLFAQNPRNLAVTSVHAEDVAEHITRSDFLVPDLEDLEDLEDFAVLSVHAEDLAESITRSDLLVPDLEDFAVISVHVEELAEHIMHFGLPAENSGDFVVVIGHVTHLDRPVQDSMISSRDLVHGVHFADSVGLKKTHGEDSADHSAVHGENSAIHGQDLTDHATDLRDRAASVGVGLEASANLDAVEGDIVKEK
jgi:hypothetical protein